MLVGIPIYGRRPIPPRDIPPPAKQEEHDDDQKQQDAAGNNTCKYNAKQLHID